MAFRQIILFRLDIGEKWRNCMMSFIKADQISRNRANAM